MAIQTIAEAEHALTPYVAVAGETTGKDITVDRTLELARTVGSPHERLRVVHVAGTSGKTSTSYFVSRLLSSTGVSVGLTVSPHIYSITERIQIGTEPIGEADFCRYLSEFLPLVEKAKEKPSYFELMMVFAMWVFDREGIDYVVLETGLGGLHDSSNICRREDKVCVITDTGLDHTQILGETLPEIAAQKAGIIASNNHLFMHKQADEIVDVIKNTADEMNASVTMLAGEPDITYQRRNARLAYAAASYTAKRDGLNLSSSALDNLDMSVPGRMQVIRRDETTIILDGAHNEQKTATLVQTLKSLYPGQKFALVVAIKETKDYKKVVALLSAIASTAIATSFELSQDTPIRAVDPLLIQEEFADNAIECSISSTVEAAVTQLCRAQGMQHSHVLVTGSLYNLGHLQFLEGESA